LFPSQKKILLISTQDSNPTITMDTYNPVEIPWYHLFRSRFPDGGRSLTYETFRAAIGYDEDTLNFIYGKYRGSELNCPDDFLAALYWKRTYLPDTQIHPLFGRSRTYFRDKSHSIFAYLYEHVNEVSIFPCFLIFAKFDIAHFVGSLSFPLPPCPHIHYQHSLPLKSNRVRISLRPFFH
jgi:hypothetical protein